MSARSCVLSGIESSARNKIFSRRELSRSRKRVERTHGFARLSISGLHMMLTSLQDAKNNGPWLLSESQNIMSHTPLAQMTAGSDRRATQPSVQFCLKVLVTTEELKVSTAKAEGEAISCGSSLYPIIENWVLCCMNIILLCRGSRITWVECIA